MGGPIGKIDRRERSGDCVIFHPRRQSVVFLSAASNPLDLFGEHQPAHVAQRPLPVGSPPPLWRLRRPTPLADVPRLPPLRGFNDRGKEFGRRQSHRGPLRPLLLLLIAVAVKRRMRRRRWGPGISQCSPSLLVLPLHVLQHVSYGPRKLSHRR